MNILFADEQDEPIVTEELLQLAETVLEAEGLDPETGVSLVLIGEDEMTELNRQHMGKTGPTDVLSFPIALMVVHGLLHLLGWDHEADEDALRMESRERDLLARVGRVRP